MEYIRRNFLFDDYQIYMLIGNKKEGPHVKYYENGQIREFCNYINDKKEGEYKLYYKNGQIICICNYINDKKEGVL